jgi:hypothetical protein
VQPQQEKAWEAEEERPKPGPSPFWVLAWGMVMVWRKGLSAVGEDGVDLTHFGASSKNLWQL